MGYAFVAVEIGDPLGVQVACLVVLSVEWEPRGLGEILGSFSKIT